MPALLTRYNPPRWRGVVTVNGVRKEKMFPDGTEKSRKAAEKWEQKMRHLLTNPTSIGMDSLTLFDLANKFLDFVKQRQSRQTYVEKLGVMKRTVKRFGKDTPIEDINVTEALAFLTEQFEKRSGYAANKERKVLVTAWNWGRKYVPGFPPCTCPFQQVDRFPEERQPRYVPPEEDFWKVYVQGHDPLRP